MDEKDFEKASQIVDKVGDFLTEENLEVAVVLSVLVSMLVSTALTQADMSGVQLLRLLSQAVEKYEDEVQLRKENDVKTNGRTTH